DVLIDVPGITVTINSDPVVSSLNSAAGIVIANSSLTVTASSVIDGDLTVNPGESLTADGVGVTVTVNGAATVNGALLAALNGAVINLPTAPSFNDSRLTIQGAGATINAAAVTDVDAARFSVSDGGTFTLAAGATSHTSSSGMGISEKRTLFSAEGAGTVLDLSALQSVTAT
ncbi:MAG: hypothetical protein GWO24_26130, partial [Akkermansiaceae bacterium]|nr:hypothetical protein [Akkermansiaceae bacterium]